MSPSGCHGHQRSTSLLHGQVAPLGLQVFPQETPTAEQAVLGMHVWVRGFSWVMSEFVLLEVMSLQVQALGLQVFPQKAPTMQRMSRRKSVCSRRPGECVRVTCVFSKKIPTMQ